MDLLHIDVDIKEPGGRVWRFTGVYGEPRSDQKFLTWEMLRGLTSPADGPWICAGDFNEILYSHEKEGGKNRPQSCMDQFREALEACDLQDLRFYGDMFTWRNNNHRVEGYIRERLDRAVANPLWRGLFPSARVFNGDPRHSDHRPVVITTEKEGRRDRSGGGGGFNFEACWLEEENFKRVVEEAWVQGDGPRI